MPHYEPKHLFDKPHEDPAEYDVMMPFINRVESIQDKGLGEFMLAEYQWPKGKPEIVFDFGCGTGIYLLPYKAAGCAIRGLDAHETAGGDLAPEDFRRWDARFPTDVQQIFDCMEDDLSDLSICFEIAEHLEEHWADRLVDTLCEHSKAILFSAAVPGQGGTYHYNEQPHEYWLTKFRERHNYTPSEFQPVLREFLEKWRPEEARGEVSGWLINNSFLLEPA